MNGKVIELNSVDDPVFANGTMGDGIAIIPKDGKLIAPFDGKVEFIFPTLHAFSVDKIL